MATTDLAPDQSGTLLNDSRIRRLADDDQYKSLKASFVLSGRGRPPSLPKVKFNNRLLLQLHLLKKDSNKAWDDLTYLLYKLYPECEFPSVQFMVDTTVDLFYQQCDSSDFESFLEESRDACIFPGIYCKKFNLSRADLLRDTFTNRETLSSCPNGLVSELCNFASKQNLKDAVIYGWLERLITTSSSSLPPPQQLKTELVRLKENVRRLRKNRGKLGGESALQAFLESPLGSGDVQCKQKRILLQSQESTGHSPAVHSPAVHDNSSRLHIEALGEVSLLRGKLNEKTRELEIKEAEVVALRELITEKKEEVKNLQMEVDKKDNQLIACQRSLQALRTKHDVLKRAHAVRRKECLMGSPSQYQKIRRLRLKLQKQEEDVQTRRELTKQLCEEKEKKRRAQVYASQVNSKRRKLQTELHTAKGQIQFLQDEADNEAAAIPAVPVTRDEKGHFKDDIVKCMIELVGENEVPVRRCNDVIQTVAKHLFSIAIPDSELPSRTTRLRFADQGQSLARIQVSEAISTQKFDLHADGTSRSHKKFVGFQVTLEDDSTLSLGFDTVAQEDAQTLLDLALSRLTECAAIYAPDDAAAQLQKLLQNMVAVMTDRASTMKNFGRLLDGVRAGQVDPGPRLEYLHCNAHFLLGLSMAAEKALMEVSKETGLRGSLGRDGMAAFRNFKPGEAEACRYIRMACDTLGPRGDEKNGCHASWDAFCAGLGRSSELKSFRANRFNNLFEAAAALTYHRQDILLFLEESRPASNLKQQSVLEDARSNEIAVMVAALGMMYVYITGPFWMFVRSNIHFLDQYTFIQPIHGYLREMIQHPSLLLNDVPHELSAFRVKDGCSPAVSATITYAVEAADRQLLLKVISVLAQHFMIVLERQLADFLPGGKYGSEPTLETRHRMKHCQLTNLLGEACFADMDFSMFKNRRATLHHHSTLNMLKRNKTISRFLDAKPDTAQSEYLARARKLAPQLRLEQQQQERQVRTKLQDLMKKQQEEKVAKEAKKINARRALLDSIQQLGGACQTRADIIKLLQSHNSGVQKLRAVKVQIRYLRDIVGASDPRLKLSGLTLAQQTHQLVSFLEEQAGQVGVEASEDADIAAALRTTRRPRVQQDSEPEPEEEDAEEEESETEGDDIEVVAACDSESDDDLPAFAFSVQGQTVAVYYDETFYLGQVLDANNAEEGTVTFMAQQKHKNVFKWPEAEDIDKVKSVYVFHHDFSLQMRNRVWVVDQKDWEVLVRKWKKYCYNYA